MEFLPNPHKINHLTGACTLDAQSHITLVGTEPAALLYAQMLQSCLRDYAGLDVPFTRGKPKAGDMVLTINTALPADHYTLTVAPGGVTLKAGSDEALCNGVQTLCQYIEQHGAVLPALEVEDWPDLANRGYYQDCSRGRVPKLDYLKQVADILCRHKINQWQLYIEHTYLFRNLSEAWREDTPLTAQEIMELDDYCAARHIELVPSLSSFGHMYRILSTNTDWGDYAHVNDPRLTIPGILYGAAFSWNAEPVEFDELNEAVSRLYYGDTTGTFAGLMAKLQDYEIFDWQHTVNWIECDEATRRKILSEVDFSKIDDTNRAVTEAKAAILAATPNLPAGKKEIVQVLCQTADVITLWNTIGAWLNAGQPHGAQADALAAQLEHWLQRYRAQWRQVSKESGLPTLTNLVCRYADVLRGRAYGAVEAPAGR